MPREAEHHGGHRVAACSCVTVSGVKQKRKEKGGLCVVTLVAETEAYEHYICAEESQQVVGSIDVVMAIPGPVRNATRPCLQNIVIGVARGSQGIYKYSGWLACNKITGRGVIVVCRY